MPKEEQYHDVRDKRDLFNVAIYIDYENVYKTLLKRQQNVLRLGFFEKIRKWCEMKGRRIVKIAVYCNFDNKDLYDSHHQTLLQSYGVETIHTSNQGKNFADLQITIDVLNAMYLNDNIDEFIIMSNDKDMTPLLNTIRLNKRKVSIITTGQDYNPTICNFSDEHICFETVIAQEAQHLIIHDIQNEFWESFCKHIENKLAEYRLSNGENAYFPHYELEYNLKNQAQYSNVMVYELANIVKLLYEKHLLFFYRYVFKQKECVAICPEKYKEIFIKQGIITEENIYKDFNIQAVVTKKYADFTN